VSNFKRVSLAGSEELFRPTRPKLLEDTDDVISEAVDRRPAPAERPADAIQLTVTKAELQLLLEAIQTAKYPEQNRPKPSLDKFQRLDSLKEKLQG
jgi:hypothetical protein